tara:strand:- start:4 stop:1005 length:1002 start_codon:yes stop_codon:yes gene_type:complete
MRIAFRVDSSNLIGAGHVSRCVRLAEELKKRKKCKKLIFITKNLSGNFNNLIKKKKYKIFLINNKKSKNNLLEDSKDTKKICEKLKIDTLILDHYFLGLAWEKRVKQQINKLVIIDDFSKKEHFCDLIINNLNTNHLKTTKHLTGLKFIIIPDNNFKQTKTNKKQKKTHTVGTFFGSIDKMQSNEKLLKIISQKEFNKFNFISILGKNNKRKNKIEKNYKTYKNLYIEKKFIKIDNFFKKIDVLITVGGVTSFEALNNNIKCIYIPINHYQKMTCLYLKKLNISNILNYNNVFGKNGKQLLIKCLNKIFKEKTKKKILIDSLGSKRIAKYILN